MRGFTKVFFSGRSIKRLVTTWGISQYRTWLRRTPLKAAAFRSSATKTALHGRGPVPSTSASIIMPAWCPSRIWRRISTYYVSMRYTTILTLPRYLLLKSIASCASREFLKGLVIFREGLPGNYVGFPVAFFLFFSCYLGLQWRAESNWS